LRAWSSASSSRKMGLPQDLWVRKRLMDPP
jgi:hypothetical protein